MKEKTLCFSGHRPEKLPDKGNINSQITSEILTRLYTQIEFAIKDGYTNFITGMARGVDIWAASYIIQKKFKNPDLKLICAIPYRKFGSNFKGGDKWDFNFILANADEIKYLSEDYNASIMRTRNEYMVDNSSRLIAVVQNYKSGTGQTIRYAEKKGITTNIISIASILCKL